MSIEYNMVCCKKSVIFNIYFYLNIYIYFFSDKAMFLNNVVLIIVYL